MPYPAAVVKVHGFASFNGRCACRAFSVRYGDEDVSEPVRHLMLLTHFGALRSALMLCGIFLALLAPDAQVRTVLEWPLIIPTLIAPSLAPLVLMAILLDMIMSAIFSAGTDDAAQKRCYRKIIIIDAAVAAIVIFRWLPFFMALARP